MNNFGVDITELYCLDFELSNKVFVSSSLKYNHRLLFEKDIDSEVIKAEVFLITSENSFKYEQEVIVTSNTEVQFITDPRSHELALFDEIQLTLYLLDGTNIRTKKKVSRAYISNNNSNLRYTSGSVDLPYSNMLYPRIKLGFPKWGSIEKNDISNGTKLLEPLLKPFYDSYHKIINFKINSLYKIPYKNYKSIFLGGRPESVMRVNLNEQDSKVFETSAIQGIPKKVRLTGKNTTQKLSRLVLDNTSSIEEVDLTQFLNTTIYIKKLKWQDEKKHWLTIKGFDKYGDILQARVELVDDFFVPSIFKFSQITDIVTDSNVLLSNYLDCRFDHFLIKDPNTLPPIVDNSLFAFFPKVVKTQNNEGTRDILHIHNSDKDLSEIAYKFDIEQTGRITSLYIDEHLRIYWTDGNKLYSSVLNHNLSKDIGKHVSNNNNSVVTVADVNTSIGDWADVSIDTDAWPRNTPMVIQVKNKDSILYYDQEAEEFTENIKYFYPKESERFIELSVKVMNEQAYIFSVFSDTLKQKYIASTHSNLLQSIIGDISCTGSIIIVDDKLQISSSFTSPTIIENNTTDRVHVMLMPFNINSFNWNFNLEGYTFNNIGGNLPAEYYNIIAGDGEYNTPVYFEVDRFNLIKNYQTTSLISYLDLSIDKLYNVEGTYQILVQLTDKYGTTTKTYTVDESVTRIPIEFTQNTKELKDAI